MKKGLLLGASCLSMVLSLPTHAQAGDALSALFDNGSFFGELRYRYETVEQDNALEDATASTVRTNIGYETGSYNGFSGLVEAQIVQSFGAEDFNSLENGKTGFSTVADPDVAQINRGWIKYDGFMDTSVKYGRQFINLDNQRFLGTVGWRQNDQTFDALTVTNTYIDGLTAQYSHISNVNRIFDGSTPPDDLDSDTHLANVSYVFSDALKATGYGYWMEFDNAASLSNETYGLRLTGKLPIDEDWTFSYEAEYAMQEDYGNSTLNYDEDYYRIAPKVSGLGFTFGAGYEVLEGNGTTGFQTPLATLHKFNGWADVFLTTPANGLEDFYLMGAYKFSGTDSVFDGVKLKAIYHEYEGDESGDFGDELNLAVSKSFMLPDAGQPFKKLNVALKYADYDAADAPYVDTEKVWLQLGIKF